MSAMNVIVTLRLTIDVPPHVVDEIAVGLSSPEELVANAVKNDPAQFLQYVVGEEVDA